MLVATIYLLLSFAFLAATLGAVHAAVFGKTLGRIMSLVGMILTFVIPQVLLLEVMTAIAAHAFGAFERAPGQIGLAIHLGCCAVLAVYLVRMHRTLPILDGSSVEDAHHPFSSGLTDDERAQLKPGQISWAPSLTYRVPAMLAVQVDRNIVYREVDGVHLRVDVYRPRGEGSNRPAVLYLHGGGWVTGGRRQSPFLMYELAAAGWTVFAVSYRLAPRFPLPAALIDAKSAVAWVRRHAGEYGANGENIVVMGGSAGGHLAAMVALTPNRVEFQPGFEGADTRVQGAVVLYGATDILGLIAGSESPTLARWIESVVFKARYKDQPELFRSMDPAANASGDAPPTLLVHGQADNVVPCTHSERFCQALRAAGARTVHLVEIPFGQHAFEIFPSPLHQRAVRVIVRFMDSVRREWRDPVVIERSHTP